MNVCVVGATGVLGRSLVPLLFEHRISVRALARFTDEKRSLLPKEADCLNFDLLAENVSTTLPSLLDGVDAVLHIATAIPRDFSAPGAWDLNNKLRTIGTRRLLDAAAARKVGYYVQQSITMRYPDCGDNWIDEDVPLVPTDQSGNPDTVTVMENMVRSVDNGIDWCMLRGGIFVGPGTFQDDAIRDLRSGRMSVPGDGMKFTSLIHVADMATAFLKALQIRPHRATLNVVA